MITITPLASKAVGHSRLYALNLQHPEFRRLLASGAMDTVLDAEEHAAIARVRQLKDRQARQATRWLLRRTLSRTLGRHPSALRFTRGTLGEVTLADPHMPIWFSMSRAPGIVVVAISHHHRIGVDVETADRVQAALRGDRTWLADSEVADDENEPAPRRSALLAARWTLKEAYLKACGVGLALAPREVSFDLRGIAPALSAERAVNPQARRWSFQLVEGAHCSTIAVATAPA